MHIGDTFFEEPQRKCKHHGHDLRFIGYDHELGPVYCRMCHKWDELGFEPQPCKNCKNCGHFEPLEEEKK